MIPNADTKTYQIRTSAGMAEAEGRPVSFDGFEGIEFCVHRTANGASYAVSETTTGLRITLCGVNTETEAILEAQRTLQRTGRAKVVESIRLSLETPADAAERRSLREKIKKGWMSRLCAMTLEELRKEAEGLKNE